MIAGSEDSTIVIFDDGEIKTEINVSFGTNESRRQVHSIIPFSKGFVCGTNNGNIFVYERSEDPKELFKKIKDFTLTDDRSSIVNLALSPNEDNLLCSTEINQIYFTGFGSTEIIKVYFWEDEEHVDNVVRATKRASNSCHIPSIMVESRGWMCASGSPWW